MMVPVRYLLQARHVERDLERHAAAASQAAACSNGAAAPPSTSKRQTAPRIRRHAPAQRQAFAQGSRLPSLENFIVRQPANVRKHPVRTGEDRLAELSDWGKS